MSAISVNRVGGPALGSGSCPAYLIIVVPSAMSSLASVSWGKRSGIGPRRYFISANVPNHDAVE